jgi:hypothetical protein
MPPPPPKLTFTEFAPVDECGGAKKKLIKKLIFTRKSIKIFFKINQEQRQGVEQPQKLPLLMEQQHVGLALSLWRLIFHYITPLFLDDTLIN